MASWLRGCASALRRLPRRGIEERGGAAMFLASPEASIVAWCIMWIYGDINMNYRGSNNQRHGDILSVDQWLLLDK